MIAVEFATYKEYCADRESKGLQVLPESFWNTLKGNSVTVSWEFNTPNFSEFGTPQ